MAKEYVVIDLETTGLDIPNDEIIEIAAVKIRRGLLIDHFSTLVSCKRELSEEISQLTGITADMLDGQPDIFEALQMLTEFVGSADLIAHNADFDGNMLHKYWPDDRVWLDTIVLSQIVWPCVSSYARRVRKVTSKARKISFPQSLHYCLYSVSYPANYG